MFISSWRGVGRFFLFVCVPLFSIAGVCVWLVDADAAMYFKPRYGNALHLWAKQTTDVAMAGPYFSISAGLWLLFIALRKLRSKSTWTERWHRAEVWSLTALLSLATSGILVQLLKHIIGRKRPYADSALSSHAFEPFTSNYEFHSLPSGHSQVLFTVATVLSAIWPRVWWAWMTIAAIFSTTRVITLNHWVSDILAGAAVGMFGAILTMRMMRTRRMKFFLQRSVVAAVTVLCVFVAPVVGRADAPGPFGIGLVIGDPTGLSANYRMTSSRSIDGALAWAFGGDPGFELHSDYLWHRASVLRGEKVAFDLHYGVGARLMSLNNRHDDRTRLGLRLPVGLSTDFNQRAIELFGEIALAMNLIPSTTADLDFGIGARVYF
jgi:membrane-associated phospholipid phosphatase